MDRLQVILTLLASLGAGMMAGLFFVFSVVIMKAFGRLAPGHGIAAMQTINQVILNPWFFVLFFGTALIGLVLAGMAVFDWEGRGSGYPIAAALVYVGGCIGVTLIWNVPLNDALAATDAGSPDGADLWSRYLDVWTRWNHVRTVACAAAAVLFTLAACEMWAD